MFGVDASSLRLLLVSLEESKCIKIGQVFRQVMRNSAIYQRNSGRIVLKSNIPFRLGTPRLSENNVTRRIITGIEMRREPVSTTRKSTTNNAASEKANCSVCWKRFFLY